MALIIGADTSGNNNNWTASGVSISGATNDSMVDVPGIPAVSSQTDVGGVVRGNYCTLNSAIRQYSSNDSTNTSQPSEQWADANLRVFFKHDGVSGSVYGTHVIPNTGKWYFEYTDVYEPNNAPVRYGQWVGIAPVDRVEIQNGTYGGGAFDVGYIYSSEGAINQSYSVTGIAESGVDLTTNYGTGDVIGVAYDADNRTISWYKNNTFIYKVSNVFYQPAGYTPCAGGIKQNTGSSSWNPSNIPAQGLFNFGATPFIYTPPAGFKSINTTNFPNPAIKRPEQQFDIKKWVGNGSELTIGNTQKQTVAYPISKSLRFRASNTNYLSRLALGALYGNQQIHTFSAWVKRGIAGTGEYPLYSAAQDSNWRYYARIEQNNIRVYFNSAGTSYEVLSFPVQTDTVQWHHLVVALDLTQTAAGNRVKIYWDGQLLANTTGSTYPPTSFNTRWGNGGSQHYIGKKDTDNTVFDGEMAEINIIDGLQLPASSFGAYDANNNWVPQRYTGSYGTMGSYLQFAGSSLGNSTYAARFNSSNYISLPSNSGYAFGTGDFTVEGWFYVNSFNGSYSSLVTTRGVSGTGFDIQVYSVNNQLMLGNPSGAIVSQNYALPLNTWVHIAGVRISGVFYMYVNGKLAASGASSQNFTDTAFYIGSGAGGGNNQWSGYASNIRVVKGVGVYTGNFTPPTTALTATQSAGTNIAAISGTQTVLLTCQNATLVDNSSNAFTVTGATTPVMTAYPFAGSPTYSTYFPGSSSLGFAANAAWALAGDFTIEGWIYRTSTGDASMCVQFNGSNYFALNVNPGTGFNLYLNAGASGITDIVPTINTWNHVALVRSGSTIKLYLNGVASSTTFSNSSTLGYSGQTFYVGGYGTQSTGSTVGNISNFRVVNGTALYTSTFTPSTSPLTAVTNTKLLACQSAAHVDNSSNTFIPTINGSPVGTATILPPVTNTVGMDTSGSGVHFGTINIDQNSGLYTYDSLADSPTDTVDSNGNSIGGHAVMMPNSQYVLSEGGLNIYRTGATQSYVLGSMPISSGKFYWEVYVNSLSSNYPRIGIASQDPEQYNNYPGGNSPTTARVWGASNGSTLPGVSPSTTGALFGTGGSNSTNVTFTGYYSTGDIVMFALDKDNNKLWVGKNGTWYADTAATTVTSSQIAANSVAAAFSDLGMLKEVYPAIFCNQTGDRFSMNFGQKPFGYAPPTGFSGINTKTLKDKGSYNLPDSFGNFVNTPDLIWLKSRSATTYPTVFDTIRGPGYRLFPCLTDGQSQDLNEQNSFTPNGFSLGTNTDANNAGSTYISWNWNRSPASGFDMISYAGNGGTQNIPHNLGVAPKFIIIKCQNYSYNWAVYHHSITGGSNALQLNNNNTTTSSYDYWNSRPPSAASFPIGADNGVNQSGYSYIAYVWAEVPGFSKVGSWTGNGSTTDGPYIYTGFRPKMVIAKRTDSSDAWLLHDTVRDTFNPTSAELLPSQSGAEYVNARFDMLSNGFKVRSPSNTATVNASGGNYIYIAFAESPFKYANAR